jgi:hypothetical protein
VEEEEGVCDGCNPAGFLTTAVTAVGVAATHNLTNLGDREHDHSHEKVAPEETMITTRFTEPFGIKHPIACAPKSFRTAHSFRIGNVQNRKIRRAPSIGLDVDG